MANKLFEIEVQEMLCRVVKVKAQSYDNALDIVIERYKKCQIVFDYNDFVDVTFQDINKQSIEDEKNNLILEIITFLYEDENRHFIESDKTSQKKQFFQKLKRLKTICM